MVSLGFESGPDQQSTRMRCFLCGVLSDIKRDAPVTHRLNFRDVLLLVGWVCCFGERCTAPRARVRFELGESHREFDVIG